MKKTTYERWLKEVSMQEYGSPSFSPMLRAAAEYPNGWAN